jgi:hypothetical protein
MMQSVALSDSNVFELDNHNHTYSQDSSERMLQKAGTDDSVVAGDFVLVTEPSLDLELDLDEYDYCDDVLSDGMQSEPGFFITKAMLLEEAEEPSIQHILDEAHSEASKLVFPELLAPKKEPCTDDLSTKETDASGPSSKSYNYYKITDPAPAIPLKKGRMPNKKRRKRMKMLKKAAAAAADDKAAAANLSAVETTSACTSTSTSASTSSDSRKKTFKNDRNNRNKGPTSRYINKRNANIAAVACATESLATYNKAVIQNKKVN